MGYNRCETIFVSSVPSVAGGKRLFVLFAEGARRAPSFLNVRMKGLYEKNF